MADRVASSGQGRRPDLGLKQGPVAKGIFGAGRILDEPRRGEARNGKTAMMAPIRFDAFVDPEKGMLIDEGSVTQILRPNQVRTQASGYPLDDNQTAAFEQLFPSAKDKAELNQPGETWSYR
jgi:hypothetical protein